MSLEIQLNIPQTSTMEAYNISKLYNYSVKYVTGNTVNSEINKCDKVKIAII